MSLMDFPNLWFEHYRRIVVTRRMTMAGKFAMLQDAFNKAEINRDEFLRLLDMAPEPEALVNAPGGAC